jgi:peptidase E
LSAVDLNERFYGLDLYDYTPVHHQIETVASFDNDAIVHQRQR